MNTISITTQIPLDDIARGLSYQQAHDLITSIDEDRSDTAFTEEVITNLINAMLVEFDGFPIELNDFKKSIIKLFD